MPQQDWQDAQEHKEAGRSPDALSGKVRIGTPHLDPREFPPPAQPVQQFFHGLLLPLHLLRALWADPVARRFYLRVALLQSLVILALGFACAPSANKAVDAAMEHGEQSESEEARQKEIEEQIEKAVERERVKVAIKLAADELVRELHKLTDAEPAPAPDKAGRPPVRAPRITLKKEPSPSPWLALLDLKFWAALIATLQIIQWGVIALSHDFHDVISRKASLLASVEPEDPEITPRIRLDVDWARKKFTRRIRALLVFALGLPALFLLTVPLPSTNTLLAVLVPLWSAYWFVVFTAAKSARAWDHNDAGDPWFLRGWKWLTTSVPGLRWKFLQRYGRFWTSHTLSVFPPASETEKLPWAFAGLSLVKALAILPVLKCFLRPLIPVASAHLLIAHRTAQGSRLVDGQLSGGGR